MYTILAPELLKRVWSSLFIPLVQPMYSPCAVCIRQNMPYVCMSKRGLTSDVVQSANGFFENKLRDCEKKTHNDWSGETQFTLQLRSYWLRPRRVTMNNVVFRINATLYFDCFFGRLTLDPESSYTLCSKLLFEWYFTLILLKCQSKWQSFSSHQPSE